MSYNDNITIKDNNSKIISILPKEWIEPLTIIARVEGYDGIDEYVARMIRERLEMFADTRDELGGPFQEYMHSIMIGKDVPNEWARNAAGDYVAESEEESSNNEDGYSKFVKDVNEGYHHDMKQADDDKENEDLK